MPSSKEKFIVSGIGTGIGLEVGKLLLRDSLVYGISRTFPAEIGEYPSFHHLSLDFCKEQSIESKLDDFIKRNSIDTIKCVFLNVGQFSQRIAPIAETSLADLQDLMKINVWSHKHMLDALLRNKCKVENAVISTSIAGVRARAGNSGYAITKSVLNMMAKLYALENPSIHFHVLGLCSVDTRLSTTIGRLPLEGGFPEIEELRSRALSAPGYLATPQKRAKDILEVLKRKQELGIVSGNFYEIRDLLPMLKSSN